MRLSGTERFCATGGGGAFGDGSQPLPPLERAAGHGCAGTLRRCRGTGPGPVALPRDRCGAYIQGHNAICDTGNGATSCRVGRFVSIIGAATVGPGVGGGVGGNNAVGIQLIK